MKKKAMQENGKKLWFVILGGDFPRSLGSVLAADPPQGVVCADSGANHAYAFGVVPQVVVGDGDSISPPALAFCCNQGVEMKRFPPQKNETDGELAMEEALHRGAEEIWLFGAFGGRLDHQLANIELAAAYVDRCVIRMIGDDFTASFLQGCQRVAVEGEVGDTISLIPLTPVVEEVTLVGFQYPLNQYLVRFGCSRTMSNVIMQQPAFVSMTSGLLMVIRYPAALTKLDQAAVESRDQTDRQTDEPV